MEIFYLKDKVCTLRRRDGSLYEESFTLEAPNGLGVHDIDIEKVDSDHYVDGNGDLATGFTDFRLCLTFHYSSNMMALERLFDFEEIDIPFSFSLNPDNEETETFILDNEEMVFNYIHGLYQGVDGENIKGGIDLVFKTSRTYTRQEIQDLLFYNWDDSVVPSPQNLSFTKDNLNPFSIENGGVSGVVSVPHSSSIDIKDGFTLEFDIKRNQLLEVTDMFYQFETSPSNAGWYFRIKADDTFRFTCIGVADVDFAVSLDNLDWNHIALTISDSSFVKLYINKVEVASQQLPASPIPATNRDLEISRITSTNMDNIRIWNFERSALQISGDADKILEGDEAGLQAYWKCDENGDPDNTLVDIAGGNNGTISGDISYSAKVRFRDVKVNLSWDSLAGIDGYNLYLSTDNGQTYVKHNAVLINLTSYDFERSQGTPFDVYVTAVDGVNESLPSNIVGSRLSQYEMYYHSGGDLIRENMGTGATEVVLSGYGFVANAIAIDNINNIAVIGEANSFSFDIYNLETGALISTEGTSFLNSLLVDTVNQFIYMLNVGNDDVRKYDYSGVELDIINSYGGSNRRDLVADFGDGLFFYVSSAAGEVYKFEANVAEVQIFTHPIGNTRRLGIDSENNRIYYLDPDGYELKHRDYNGGDEQNTFITSDSDSTNVRSSRDNKMWILKNDKLHMYTPGDFEAYEAVAPHSVSGNVIYWFDVVPVV